MAGNSVQMKLFSSIFISSIFCFCSTCLAQDAAFQAYDYSPIGLHFQVPKQWTHDGLTTTTKAEFIKQFGWIYTKPDADDIWNAVGRFSSMSVDSSLIPSDSAYTIHSLIIFVNRANTLYKRWLCLHRRSNIFEARPLVKDNHILTIDEHVTPYNLPSGLTDAKGRFYEYYSDQIRVPTTGHVFTFVHQEKCFELKLESTSSDVFAATVLHSQILNSIKLQPF